jgi:lipopolysaccharide/colanic/teichoic acid biosynthesis glycosyltransferase
MTIMVSHVSFDRPSLADRVFVCLLLLVLAPLFLVIALAIKLDTPGPILAQSRREDRSGHNRMALRFRTVAVADCGKPLQAQVITRVGRLLQETEFERLPALLNIALNK